MSRYVAVRAMDVGTIETLGGIGNMSCRCYWLSAPSDDPATVYDAAQDESAVVYDLDTGDIVAWEYP